MKILGLRFANLNSLEGEWEIDFSSPEFVSDGIFAITGPTGSGKSTILDALCLALYGQTPRLGKVTKGGNEIMSRHAGDCFAEATFSTINGSFRCHWSQHRARRRSGGELQAQKHEISDAASGQVLHTKLQDTLAAVEAVTGMDFERFTRSMLLAQGGFAAFLQADPDRRSPVLEQITGTEVYSRISVKVHERQREELTKLERLRADTGNLKLLDEEKLDALRSDVERLLTEASDSAGRLEAATAAIRSHAEVDRLHEELAGIEQDMEKLAGAKKAFGPEAARLEKSRTAGSLEKPYAALLHQRQELQRESEKLADRERERPEVEATVQRDRMRLDKAIVEHRTSTESEAIARPLHEQVRMLDKGISDKRKERDSKQLALDESILGFETLKSERDRLAASLEQKQQELALIGARLLEASADARLVSELSGIRLAFGELQAAARRRDSSRCALDDSANLEDAGIATNESFELDAAKAKEALDEADGLVSSLQADLAILLEGKGLHTWRIELQSARDRKKLLEEISTMYTIGREFVPKIQQVSAEIANLEAARVDTEGQLVHARELLARAENEVSLIEENLRLSTRLESYEDERRRLAAGEPCPLCGSTIHPYVSGREPAHPDGKDRLEQSDKAVKLHAASVRALEISMAESGAGIEQRKLRRSELERDREDYGRKCLTLLRDAAIVEAPREAEPAVLEALEASTRTVAGLATMVEKGETIEQDILKAVYAQALQGYLARMAGLQQRILPYGIRLGPDHDGPAIVEELESRSERHIADEAKKRTFDAEIMQYEAAIAGIGKRIVSDGNALQGDHKTLEKAEGELQSLLDRRKELFGDKDPVVEAANMTSTITLASRELDEAREALTVSMQSSGVLETAMGALTASIEKRKGETDTLASTFLEGLRRKGFENEAAFSAASIPEEESRHLEAIADELLRKGQQLEARRLDRNARLQETLEGIVDPRTPDELSSLIPPLQENLQQTREKIGAIRQQLADNERIAVKHRRMAEAMEAQSAECRRWDSLHELIGSADGKKFRNFAQGLTFEIMVGHANRQLASMTDRYQLVRDESIPLELNVVDTWQAGQVRSTRNLSGGESFIVSLSLALGLSQMSSRNVRVDSLFLDEGFGTLDEEALETALETLAGLQHSGKLIGVISHVPALKERISTQIQVTQLTGGRSAISGPGVAMR
ncbi:MAG: AAA family ATPase [Chlorobiaceae bacterium]|nr:AAA family ATPase [Chlorobiaceae bacterium]